MATEMSASLPVNGSKGMSAAAQLKADAGSAATPGITWTSDLDTGFLSTGANAMGIAVGGVKVTDIDAFGIAEGVWTDLASATTTDLSTVLTKNVRITGTTTIASFGTVRSGLTRKLRFAGILTLTYNATSLILPTGASIVTAAGDTAEAISLGSGNWIVVNYTRANGTALVGLTSSITLGTPAASTSGTSIDFNGVIPATAKRVTVMFLGVSTTGTSPVIVQLGAGSVDTSGYLTASGVNNDTPAANMAPFTNGFPIYTGTSGASVAYGQLILSYSGSSNTWTGQGFFWRTGSNNAAYFVGGIKALSGTLDRIRVTTSGGTDTFDLGTINIAWEV